MSARAGITNALVEKLKEIDGKAPYNTKMFDSVSNKLQFWDELHNFPHICVVAGQESREYLPSDFKWGYLNIALKLYVKAEEPLTHLENLLEDVERVIEGNRNLVYDTGNGQQVTEMQITSIITDEGLLAPYGVGEVTIQVRYQVLG